MKKELKEFGKLEKSLLRFFKLFDDLCSFCFEQTKQSIGNRKKLDFEKCCCCLVDNQVHDHWKALEKNQKQVIGPNWIKCLNNSSNFEFKKAGKGPCPALSDKGCSLKSHRPPTCTTQLCSHMVMVLENLGICGVDQNAIQCQIEDILKVPSPLNALYGIGKSKVDTFMIERFQEEFLILYEKFRSIRLEDRQRAISVAKEKIMFETSRSRRIK